MNFLNTGNNNSLHLPFAAAMTKQVGVFFSIGFICMKVHCLFQCHCMHFVPMSLHAFAELDAGTTILLKKWAVLCSISGEESIIYFFNC